MSLRLGSTRISHAPFDKSTAAIHEVVAGSTGNKIVVVGGYLRSAGTNTAKFHTSTSDEVQTVTVSGGAGVDEFTLTYSGQTTSALLWDVSAADMKTALEALSNIGVGDVSVSYVAAETEDGGVYTITFATALADTNVAQLTSTPTGCTVTHATTTAGGTIEETLTGAIPLIAGSDIPLGTPECPFVETGSGEGLFITLSQAQQLAGVVSYVIIPA